MYSSKLRCMSQIFYNVAMIVSMYNVLRWMMMRRLFGHSQTFVPSLVTSGSSPSSAMVGVMVSMRAIAEQVPASPASARIWSPLAVDSVEKVSFSSPVTRTPLSPSDPFLGLVPLGGSLWVWSSLSSRFLYKCWNCYDNDKKIKERDCSIIL